MSLELKAVLLTVALVAYLLLFNLSPCWHVPGNGTETNGTHRWGYVYSTHMRGWCLCSPLLQAGCFDLVPG